MNLKGKRFCFAGNRSFVLDEMFSAGLDVTAVFATSGSFLERELTRRGVRYEPITNKASFLRRLAELQFDVFVANGLPLILPMAELERWPGKTWINVHPSCLPDLRGADPVPGALLHGRDSGATCHFMSDVVDGGDIIENMRIAYNRELDSGLLYQLTFAAERTVFRRALAGGFSQRQPQRPDAEVLYYTQKESDRCLDFSESAEAIFRRVRAFNTASRGTFFEHAGHRFFVGDAELVNHAYVMELAAELAENTVLFAYEGRLLIKKAGACIKLVLRGDQPAIIRAGDLLGSVVIPTPMNRQGS